MDKKHFLNFAGNDNGTAVIEIYGTIGGWDWEEWREENTIKAIAKELKQLKELKTDRIEVRICSLGGSVEHALAIHDALKDHPAHVTTVINSFCASAATIVALAGDERKISSNALYLIHKCSSGVYGNEHDLETELESQKAVNSTMYNMYKTVFKKEESILTDLFNYNNGNGKWLSAEEVLSYGFADVIYNAAATPKAALLSRYIWDKIGLPALPATASVSIVSDRDNLPLIKRIIEKGRELFPADTTNLISNKKTEDMKKFNKIYPVMALVFATLAEQFYDPEDGLRLTDNDVDDMEKVLKAKMDEFEALKADKTELEKTVADLTAERDDFKAKYEAAPAAVPAVNGSDNNGGIVDVTANPIYKELEKYI